MQFSLRTLLITLFVLTLAASHLYTSWKLNQAQAKLLALRNEVGYLTIVDPERLNVLYAPKGPGHRWRVYVPKGARYTLSAVAARIPAKGHPVEDEETRILDMDLPEGEFTLTARLERLEDAWRLTVNAGDAGAQLAVRDEDACGLQPGTGGAEIAALAGRKGVETFDRRQSFDLLRRHEWRLKGKGTFTTPGPKPSDGLLIWVKAQ